MSAAARLPIYEEILLLALDDDKGTTALDSLSTFSIAMGGAMLAELAMAGAIKIDRKKKAEVKAVAGASVQDPLLAECLQKIRDEKKTKKAAHWVQKFSGTKDLKNRAARQMVTKGILKEGSDRVLGIFPRTIYPESDPGPEKELRDRLYWAIFTSAQEVDPGTVVVTALLHGAGLMNRVFDKKKLKSRKQRLEKLTSGQVVGTAAKEAVEAAQAAVMVATMVPIFVASS